MTVPAAPDRGFAIRACRPEDLGQVLVIEEQSFPDPFDRDIFLQLLAAEPQGFLVAEVGGRVVGYVTAIARRGEGWIYSLAIEPESRRRRLGRTLMEAVLKYLSSRAKRVYLQVSVNNVAAIVLYERLSFVRTKRLRRYYPNGDDAFLMVLDFKHQ